MYREYIKCNTYTRAIELPVSFEVRNSLSRLLWNTQFRHNKFNVIGNALTNFKVNIKPMTILNQRIIEQYTDFKIYMLERIGSIQYLITAWDENWQYWIFSVDTSEMG